MPDENDPLPKREEFEVIDPSSTPKKERFADIRAEARRRIEARNRATDQLARKIATNDPDAEEPDTLSSFDEFEARLFEDISEWLDKEDQYRTVTIEELMQVGRNAEDKA